MQQRVCWSRMWLQWISGLNILASTHFQLQHSVFNAFQLRLMQIPLTITIPPPPWKLCAPPPPPPRDLSLQNWILLTMRMPPPPPPPPNMFQHAFPPLGIFLNEPLRMRDSHNVASFPVLTAPAFISQPWRKSKGEGLVLIIMCRKVCMHRVDLYAHTRYLFAHALNCFASTSIDVASYLDLQTKVSVLY